MVINRLDRQYEHYQGVRIYNATNARDRVEFKRDSRILPIGFETEGMDIIYSTIGVTDSVVDGIGLCNNTTLRIYKGSKAAHTVFRNAECYVNDGGIVEDSFFCKDSKLYALEGSALERVTVEDGAMAFIYAGCKAGVISVNNGGYIKVDAGAEVGTIIAQKDARVLIQTGADVKRIKKPNKNRVAWEKTLVNDTQTIDSIKEEVDEMLKNPDPAATTSRVIDVPKDVINKEEPVPHSIGDIIKIMTNMPMELPKVTLDTPVKEKLTNAIETMVLEPEMPTHTVKVSGDVNGNMKADITVNIPRADIILEPPKPIENSFQSEQRCHSGCVAEEPAPVKQMLWNNDEPTDPCPKLRISIRFADRDDAYKFRDIATKQYAEKGMLAFGALFIDSVYNCIYDEDNGAAMFSANTYANALKPDIGRYIYSALGEKIAAMGVWVDGEQISASYTTGDRELQETTISDQYWKGF